MSFFVFCNSLSTLAKFSMSTIQHRLPMTMSFNLCLLNFYFFCSIPHTPLFCSCSISHFLLNCNCSCSVSNVWFDNFSTPYFVVRVQFLKSRKHVRCEQTNHPRRRCLAMLAVLCDERTYSSVRLSRRGCFIQSLRAFRRAGLFLQVEVTLGYKWTIVGTQNWHWQHIAFGFPDFFLREDSAKSQEQQVPKYIIKIEI